MDDSPRFQEAFGYAQAIHSRQIRRKTGMPRLAHLLIVAGTVLEFGGTEEEAIAALLHDAVEDAGGPSRLVDIRERFGESIASIVDGCTKPETDSEADWKERKQVYVDHLFAGSASVRLVAAADKLHNARALLRTFRTQGDEIWKRYRGGKDGTLWYYRTLLTGFQRDGPAALADELERVVTEIERVT